MTKDVGHLAVVPAENQNTVSLAVRKVAGQVAPQAGPQQRRDAAGRWKMVLVDVVQNLDMMI